MMLDISDILIPKRLRAVDEVKVKQLAESIRYVGLVNPIIVTRGRLIAGAHRLEAYKLLGWNKIPTRPLGDINEKDKIKLIEIDENLFRNELSPSEKMEHIALRIEIIANNKTNKESSLINDIDKVDILKIKKQAIHDSKIEMMELMNLKTLDVINKKVSDYTISVNTNIINNKNIDLLTNTQLRDVIRIARKDSKKADLLINEIASVKNLNDRNKFSVKNKEPNYKKIEFVKAIKKSMSINKKIFSISNEESTFNDSDFEVVRKSILEIENILIKYKF
ncbi:hypothetical protein GLP21_19495 [Photobacterium carnosum]|uniref:ParB N-terminal domain-containing protein n=1 Tax=Photobacterium carnosum TaxID=2023717 RepID=UPI001E3A6BE7|nr:ParB N-terminal domain-containing protein [Photobacterium carnosum]MCD9550803.1 hypothetical protein [Photobacterium carnosum]MCF2304684.1 hypothetical protein [Photobacterium carnosum]